MKNLLHVGLITLLLVAGGLAGCSQSVYKEHTQTLTNGAGVRFTLVYSGKKKAGGISESDIWHKEGDDKTDYFMQLRVKFNNGTYADPEFTQFK